MARVTVEPCIDKVENRVHLAPLVSHRARIISWRGADSAVERDNDKNPRAGVARDRREGGFARGHLRRSSSIP